jgi:alpha-D-xyloside xylohydrolase
MADELSAMGIKLMVSVWPQVALDSENFEEMKAQGLLIRQELGFGCSMRFFDSDTLFFDATNPKARRYVWEKCKQNYFNKGVALFWLDEAEPEYSVYDFENYRYFLGPNAQIGNIYPQLFSKAFYEGMEETGQKEIVNLIRCAWAGSQRYGALVWSGDIHSSFEHFRRQICAGLHMGISGIPWWTTDIGGFSGGDPDSEAFRELLVRWFQYGTFCPVMRLHGERLPSQPVPAKSDRRVLNTGGDNEVWSFGKEAYKILARYMRLREAMRPYTRSLMREAHEKGSPVMRTMFYEFPADEACWDLKDQYMFGADILVAPVAQEGAVSRAVYLPKGADWVDANGGTRYSGGQTVSVRAPLDIIPVFLRNGRQKELFQG